MRLPAQDARITRTAFPPKHLRGTRGVEMTPERSPEQTLPGVERGQLPKQTRAGENARSRHDDLVAQQTHVAPPTSTECQHYVRRHWHPMMFLIILFIAAASGFYYKSHADPGIEPTSFRNQPPEYINVYETNPRDPVSIHVYLTQSPYPYPELKPLRSHGFTYFREEITVTVRSIRSAPPGAVTIVSNTKPPASFDQKPVPIRNPLPGQKFVLRLSLERDHRSDSSVTWSGIAEFGWIPIIFEDNGSIFGHLPSIGAFDFSEGNPPDLLRRNKRGTRQSIYMRPGTDLTAPHGGQLFWNPSNILYSEEVQNLVPLLKTEQIDYLTPSASSNDDTNDVWHSTGCCGLEPTFKATDPDAADSQGKAAFISGIAFGVAGAAAIAVVQELPKELPIPRWQRKPKRRYTSPSQKA
jgi:hypothetical protein